MTLDDLRNCPLLAPACAFVNPDQIRAIAGIAAGWLSSEQAQAHEGIMAIVNLMPEKAAEIAAAIVGKRTGEEVENTILAIVNLMPERAAEIAAAVVKETALSPGRAKWAINIAVAIAAAAPTAFELED